MSAQGSLARVFSCGRVAPLAPLAGPLEANPLVGLPLRLVFEATMAEINKLSAGQALDKLRGADAPRSKMTRLDEEIRALDQETQRLRMTRRRLERNQRAGLTRPDGQEANTGRVTKLIISGAMIGVVVVTLVLAWNGWLF